MRRSNPLRITVFVVAALGLAACGSSSATATHPSVGYLTAPSTTSTRPRPSILASWCGLVIGDDKAVVLAKMPTPNGSRASAFVGKFDAVEWDTDNDILLATFTNGKATNLQAYAGA